MICQPCREAGALVKIAGCTDPNTTAYLHYQAQNLHKECKGGTWCDCQHAMQGVNWAALKCD